MGIKLWCLSSRDSSTIETMRIRSMLLIMALVASHAACRAEELDGSLHFTGGTNQNPNSARAFAAGLHLDPALFFSIKSQIFDAGLAYDRVQDKNGLTLDFRSRVAFLRCYGSEYQCEAKRRFWFTAIPAIGKRFGDGGLGFYAATQVQAVFDLREHFACCKFAVGVQHRFPLNSSLHGDNTLVLELRMPLMFRDPPPLPPPPPPANTQR